MRRRIPSPPRRRTLLVAAAIAVLLGGSLLWLRDSSFFKVEEVRVTGASGPDASKVEAALRSVARDMTTLNVDEKALRQAVERYPTVGSLEIDSDLPNGLRITVLERRPVAIVTVAGREVPLTADGRMLEGATAASDLPTLSVKTEPGRNLSDDRGRQLLAMVAAAPTPLRKRARRAYLGPNGLTLSMDEGPSLYFGNADALGRKWQAASRVLADPTTEGARYIDVRVPARTAVGGLPPLTTPEEAAEETAPQDAQEPAPEQPITPQEAPVPEAVPSA
jgi:cell division protein FtsQ